MSMNHDYDRHLVTGQIRAMKEQLAEHVRHLELMASSIDDVTGRIVGIDQHAYHTDNAARNLEQVAQGLDDIAQGVRQIATRTLYPVG